jgi:hypothetical protein
LHLANLRISAIKLNQIDFSHSHAYPLVADTCQLVEEGDSQYNLSEAAFPVVDTGHLAVEDTGHLAVVDTDHLAVEDTVQGADTGHLEVVLPDLQSIQSSSITTLGKTVFQQLIQHISHTLTQYHTHTHHIKFHQLLIKF